MRQLVVGLGQIGSAIRAVLECDGVDKELDVEGKYDVVHICIPYDENFDANMVTITDKYDPDLVVIHSTVAPGTSDKHFAVHSPVRGKHPDLQAGVQLFTKFFGGERAEEAAKLFRARNVTCVTTPKAITTEIGKLWDTEQYRENVLLEKKIHDICEKTGADFDIVYTQFNQTYNEGYEALGEPQYKKYVLKHMEGPIGGHCLEPNHKIIYAERPNPS